MPSSLWMPGTSFLYPCRWAPAEQGSLIRSRPSSSRHESCQLPCTKWKCVPLRHPPGQKGDPGPLHRERQLYLDMTVPPSQGAAGKTPHQTESRFPPSHLWPALSCRKLSVAHLFSLSGALGPFAEPPQSSIVLGGKQLVNLKRGIDIGWLFSFTEKF